MPADTGPGRAPSAETLARIAERALTVLPGPFRKYVSALAIRVEEFPDAETMRAMELESEFELLGLYQGVSLDRQSVSDVRQDLDRIYLYRRPILDYWCESGEELEAIVRHVLIHEIGHHFGFSDDDMERLEDEA